MGNLCYGTDGDLLPVSIGWYWLILCCCKYRKSAPAKGASDVDNDATISDKQKPNRHSMHPGQHRLQQSAITTIIVIVLGACSANQATEQTITPTTNSC